MSETIQLADGYSSSDPTGWFTVGGISTEWRLQFDGDTNLNGQTAQLVLRDEDGADSGAPITFSTGENTIGASSPQQQICRLRDGDQVRLEFSGAPTSVNAWLVPMGGPR